MRALKTIVATAVIVFALTTVAMAGVQHLGGAGTAAPQAAPATTQTVAQPAAPGDVTLSAHQFAALLRAVRRDGDGTPDGNATHTQARAHTHARQQDHTRASSGAGGATPAATHHTGTHHGTTHHTGTATHDGGTHNGGTTHDGTHDGTTHDGGGHDGGENCD